jgi:GIY-YIG catalytic domain-containing protein
MNLGDFGALLRPERVWCRDEILVRHNCPVPRVPGLYAWYFLEVPPGVPTERCHWWQGLPLLYVGISPKRPPINGKPASRQRLWNRIRYHVRGNAYGSTLRLTLGCLLGKSLGIRLRRVGSGKRFTFADGEEVLSEWMSRNARVAWMPHPAPWDAESFLISNLDLPLNLEDNSSNLFHPHLSALRDRCRTEARADVVWTADSR